MKERPKTKSKKSAAPAPSYSRKGSAPAYRKKGISPADLSSAEMKRLMQELEVHQVELELQNQHLRSAQGALETSRNRYSDLYDFAPVGYFALDSKGMIVEVNLTGANRLDVEWQMLIRSPFHLYVAPEDKRLFRAHLIEVFEDKGLQHCEIKMLRRGEIFYARLESVYAQDMEGATLCRIALIDITQQKNTEEELYQSNETLKAFIEASPLAIYALDTDGKVLHWNRAAEQIFGWSEPEVVGRPLVSLPNDNIDQFYSLLQRVLRGESFSGFETRRIRKDGSLIDVNISMASVRDQSNRVSGVIAMVQDITDKKGFEKYIQEMNDALRKKNREVEEASQARKKFFSYISHELKTPLNSIVGFAQLLSAGVYGGLTRDQLRALNRIQSNTAELVQLINNILDLAKIESGKTIPRLTEVNLGELIQKITMPFEPFLREKELQFRIKINPRAPKSFRTDPTRLRSILTNLLSNAIKFTERGKIEILLDPLSQGAGIRLQVCDKGAGMKQEDLKRLFEDFEQVEELEDTAKDTAKNTDTAYARGTGLGLAIVKKMIESLEGKLKVETSIGHGTRFVIEFPPINSSSKMSDRVA